MELLFGKHIHSQLLLHAFIFGFYFFESKLVSKVFLQFEKSLFRAKQFVFGKCNRVRVNSNQTCGATKIVIYVICYML